MAEGGDERQVALDLVEVVGDEVADVEERARVVDADGGDRRDTGQPQQQGERERGLVEAGQDSGLLEASRSHVVRGAHRSRRRRRRARRDRSTAPGTRRCRRRRAAARRRPARSDRTASSPRLRSPARHARLDRPAARHRGCRDERRGCARSSPRPDQDVDGLGQVTGDDGCCVDLRRPRGVVRNEYRHGAGSRGRVHVGPDVTDHRAVLGCHVERGGRLLDQAGSRLAAAAVVG